MPTPDPGARGAEATCGGVKNADGAAQAMAQHASPVRWWSDSAGSDADGTIPFVVQIAPRPPGSLGGSEAWAAETSAPATSCSTRA